MIYKALNDPSHRADELIRSKPIRQPSSEPVQTRRLQKVETDEMSDPLPD